jgi:hypothetical protein
MPELMYIVHYSYLAHVMHILLAYETRHQIYNH